MFFKKTPSPPQHEEFLNHFLNQNGLTKTTKLSTTLTTMNKFRTKYNSHNQGQNTPLTLSSTEHFTHTLKPRTHKSHSSSELYHTHTIKCRTQSTNKLGTSSCSTGPHNHNQDQNFSRTRKFRTQENYQVQNIKTKTKEEFLNTCTTRS